MSPRERIMAIFDKERLIKLRTQFKLSQEELALKIKVSKKQVSAWETGRSEPRNDSLVQLARFFGVSTDYLLHMAEEDEPRRLREPELTPDQRKLLSAFDRGDLDTILALSRKVLKKHRDNRR
jgi:transcriptional regulator with XRE-family HTH domain